MDIWVLPFIPGWIAGLLVLVCTGSVTYSVSIMFTTSLIMVIKKIKEIKLRK